MELLVDVQRRVFPTVNPSKIIELFKLGEGNPPTLGIKTADVVDGFYSFLGFPRLVESAAIKKAIARGIQEGFFGYYSGATPVVGKRWKVSSASGPRALQHRGRRRRDRHGSGFLMMPQALPLTEPLLPLQAQSRQVPLRCGNESTLILTSPVGVPSMLRRRRLQAGLIPRSLSRSISQPTGTSFFRHGTPSRTLPTLQAR